MRSETQPPNPRKKKLKPRYFRHPFSRIFPARYMAQDRFNHRRESNQSGALALPSLNGTRR